MAKKEKNNNTSVHESPNYCLYKAFLQKKQTEGITIAVSHPKGVTVKKVRKLVTNGLSPDFIGNYIEKAKEKAKQYIADSKGE